MPLLASSKPSKKGACGVSLANAPHPHAVIDLDKAGSPLGKAQTKCDFLFFADPNLIVIDFRPVLVSKELRRNKQFELRQASVQFRKREEKIRRVACGAPLAEVLGSPRRTAGPGSAFTARVG